MGVCGHLRNSFGLALLIWVGLPDVTMPDTAIANPLYCDARVERRGREIHLQLSNIVELKIGIQDELPVAKLRLKDVLGSYAYDGVYLKPGKLVALRGYINTVGKASKIPERLHLATLIATVDPKHEISWAVRISAQTPSVLSGKGERVMCGTTTELLRLFSEVEQQGADLFEVHDVEVSSAEVLARALTRRS